MSDPELWIYEAVSGLDTVEEIRGTLTRMWRAHSEVPASVRAEIEIAAAEIAANIVEHTAGGRPVNVRMEALVAADEVQVRFIDDGQALDIDLDSVRLPDRMAERGRGLAVARAVLRRLSYHHDGSNVWTLVSERFSA